MSKITIAIDAMSGDRGVDVVVPASLRIIEEYPNLRLILVGDRSTVLSTLAKYKAGESDQIKVHHASEVVAMDELPSQALRYKKDSSMRVALNLVKEGAADACVSAGNTGALMATARFVLKTIPGIDRPAILTTFPSRNEYGRVRVLDLGANVDSSAHVLFQFAVMGSVLTSAMDSIAAPKVALLNIGAEEIKGNEQVKETARLLSESKTINYIGFAEGDDIFKGIADVIVCDGFVGNVALKAIEGLARYIGTVIKEAFKSNIFSKLAALCSYFVMKSIKKRLDPSRYNGASLLGLRGIVIKSHGGTTVRGFETAIKHAMDEVKHNVPELIKTEVERAFSKEHVSLKQKVLRKLSDLL